MASAAPSTGSVPAQISSNNTSDLSSAFSRIRIMFVIWEENVLRLCSILCSSPISAKISVNNASSDPSSAGICRPDNPISSNNPTVFKETVLPPVFGPVTISWSNVSPRWISIGTTFLASNNGCLPHFILIIPLSLNTGSQPFISLERAAFAKIKSRCVRIWRLYVSSSVFSPTKALSSARILSISSFSFPASSRSSLFI